MHIGGIFGYTGVERFPEFYIRNCVNYGSITVSGKAETVHIGGIVGSSFMEYSDKTILTTITNSMNFGTISYDGTAMLNLYIGCIVGYNLLNDIDNCVNYGTITLNKKPEHIYIGSIAGNLTSSTVTYCYTHEKIDYLPYGHISNSTILQYSKFNDEFKLSEAKPIGGYTGDSLVKALNARADSYYAYRYSQWILNDDKKTATFKVSNGNGIKLKEKLMISPVIFHMYRYSFGMWHKDVALTTPFTENTIDSDISLYWSWYVNLKFDFQNGTKITVPFKYNETITYPEPPKDGPKFLLWSLDDTFERPYEETRAIEEVEFYALYDSNPSGSFSFPLKISSLLSLLI